jgi:hypothetical protein
MILTFKDNFILTRVGYRLLSKSQALSLAFLNSETRPNYTFIKNNILGDVFKALYLTKFSEILNVDSLPTINVE